MKTPEEIRNLMNAFTAKEAVAEATGAARAGLTKEEQGFKSALAWVLGEDQAAEEKAGKAGK